MLRGELAMEITCVKIICVDQIVAGNSEQGYQKQCELAPSMVGGARLPELPAREKNMSNSKS